MGGNATADLNGYQYLSIPRALEIARNSEGGVDPVIANYLEKAIQEVWARLHSQPQTYIFTKDEFSLFTYYGARFQNSEIARRAVQRFWNYYQGNSS